MDRTDSPRRWRWPVLAAATVLGAAAAVVSVAPFAVAAAGCQVSYTVTNQWPGGFGASVAITNLGDPVNGWQLDWNYSAGQTVTQVWSATVSQTGSAVTATNVSYDASIGTGATVSFGFNGSWTGSNPSPSSFTLNGTACTGGVTNPTSSPTTQPPTTAPPTSAPPSNPPSGQGPCDIYAAGGTPCVAAHSTTRALYASYSGPLYQVRRSSDNTTRDIGVLSTGGYANAATQDSFCAGTTCLITVIYDQSGRHNNLTQAPPGGFAGPAAGGYDNLANATAAPTTVGGHKAYGVYIAAGTGYRDNQTNGIATGDQPEGMYAIFDGTHYNGGCCFDYGNAETNSRDDGNGTMEAIYFGNIKVWGYGTGNGPWIMADLENGLFSGVNQHYNANDPTINHRYTTAIVKGEPNHWSIRGGNAQSGGLSTFYNGPRPNVSGYNPMKKQGAIILGIGGDNSHGATGTFYEGVMTSGYPSDATENAVQANIVAAGYGTYDGGSGDGGTPFTPGTRVALKATTACCTSDYIQHDASDDNVVIANVTSSSSATDKADATWVVRSGLADSSCVSFEAVNASGSYLRHQNFQLHLQANDGSSLFAQDATFCPTTGNSGQGWSFRSVNYTDRYLRHYAYIVYLASDGGSNDWDATASWADDTSWLAAPPWV